MKLLITKYVTTTWVPNNVKYYKDKGYIYTKTGEQFEVKTDDLPDNSHVLVDIECDGCETVLENIIWQAYKKGVKKDNKYYCSKCANNGYKKYINFEQWCYENLSKEYADEVLSRWDYDKNIDKNGKILFPKDVSFCSIGEGKGYWFKCLKNINHESEQKKIGSFTSGEGSLECKQCFSILTTHPHLIKYLKNKDDAKIYHNGSNKTILTKCPDCGYEKLMIISSLTKKGYNCSRCSDFLSYPEKFFISFLNQLNMIFETQLSKKNFKWCNKYKYDFYLNEMNCIVETHGSQHYDQASGNWESLVEIQNNDKLKEFIAKNNNINNYITLDCRCSEMEWIKNSILNSELLHLLKIKDSDINWLQCHEFACSSLVKLICDLWNSGIKNAREISNKINLSKITVYRYLKRGEKLGWCDYNPKEEIKKNYISLNERNKVKIICLTTEEIFDSALEAANNYNIFPTSISACCKGRQKSTGKHPETGIPLQWRYYDNYVLVKYIKNTDNRLRQVICVNTNEIFESIIQASKKYNISKSNISACCSGKLKSSGIHPETGKKLKWKYYDKNNFIEEKEIEKHVVIER